MKKTWILPLLILPFTLTSCRSIFNLMGKIISNTTKPKESSEKVPLDDESHEKEYHEGIHDPNGYLLPNQCRYSVIRETNKFDNGGKAYFTCDVIINGDEILAIYPNGEMRYFIGSYLPYSDDPDEYRYAYIYKEYDYTNSSGWSQSMYGGGRAAFCLDTFYSALFFKHSNLKSYTKTAYTQEVNGYTCDEYYTQTMSEDTLLFAYYSPDNDIFMKYATFTHEEGKDEIYDMYYMSGYSTTNCEITIKPNI